MSVLLEPLRALLNMITSLINGLIVGALHFILNLGSSLFPFLPSEWTAIIEASLIVLVIGVIIKRRVF